MIKYFLFWNVMYQIVCKFSTLKNKKAEYLKRYISEFTDTQEKVSILWASCRLQKNNPKEHQTKLIFARVSKDSDWIVNKVDEFIGNWTYFTEPKLPKTGMDLNS